ncbi:MAG: thioredoxin domain-containing protein [Planctomycetales bacterium]|jgi:thiol-disulfide isomerase/thioredoxin
MSGLTSLVVALAAVGGTPDGVLLDFSASWCGPCQQMMPVVHRLQKQGYAIRTVDVDREPALAQRFNISHMPTFVLIVKGQEQQRYTGMLSEAQLRRMASMIPQKSASAPPTVPKKPLFVAGVNLEPAAERKGLIDKIGDALTGRTDPASNDASGPPRPSQADVVRANIGDTPTPKFTRDPMEVCTRIRVKDSSGMDIGSGTIIHSEPGKTLILTCGHIFRHFDDTGLIEVDVFQGDRPRMYDGELVKFDLKADVGLISISTLETLAAARVSRQSLNSGQLVFSVGCGGGEPPSKLQHRVTSTTKFPAGYVECTGTPIQGRSGGGLFTVNGEVSGVCVLADPAARRGLYTSLETIHALLDRCGHSSIYRNAAEVTEPLFVAQPANAELDADDGAEFVGQAATNQDELPPFVEPDFATELAAGEAATANDELPTELLPGSQDQGVATPDAFAGVLALVSGLSKSEAAGQGAQREESKAAPSRRPFVSPNAELLRGDLEAARGAEVVCIIRDRSKPDGPSRIVIIHEASDRFVSDLTSEVENQVQPTSLKVRNPQVRPPSAPGNVTVPVKFSRYRRQR